MQVWYYLCKRICDNDILHVCHNESATWPKCHTCRVTSESSCLACHVSRATCHVPRHDSLVRELTWFIPVCETISFTCVTRERRHSRQWKIPPLVYVWHDSSPVCDMTEIPPLVYVWKIPPLVYVWHDPLWWKIPPLVYVWHDMTRHMCATWLVFMCDTNSTHVSHTWMEDASHGRWTHSFVMKKKMSHISSAPVPVHVHVTHGR